ncbi:SPFH domain-containing protein [Magnetofaba australis]|uniref:Putative virion core protein (Lumpy skin disease virus)-like protein n=1 Tax=Magnetofaba australis IT-1 TaxID=1434232 RepID=A0A1Y2K7E2_9PROT|nr:SPFH domain-containing protein [Magnetofaba australis]OSM04292.1 putative virion core protein (lumpy skin disease virus)-like protein [Magnetofaba australis IT-1]
MIDIIEWTDDSNDTLVYRFERHDNEIKNGAKLTVRESQNALFVNEGQVADLFPPGMHTLTTQNLPILSTLKGWKYGFDSPFKAEVYFVSLRTFTNLKWGAKNPIILRDREFGPVRLRGFGSDSLRIVDPNKFIPEIAGADGHFTLDEISEKLRALFLSRFSDLLGESRIPLLDLATQYDELGALLLQRIGPDFATYGLEMSKPLIENISLSPEVEKMLDKRSSMSILGDMGQYSQCQSANAMRPPPPTMAAQAA